jgi:rhodanese-related sulfurtransferase
MDRLLPFIVHNWMLFVALIVVLALLFVNLTRSLFTGFREISPGEAVRLMNDEDAVLVDTRTHDEFANGHILNAVNLPLADLQDRLAELQAHRGRPIVIYCESGRRSAQAGALLKKNGFDRVVGLAGGLTAWRRAGLPLQKVLS